MTVTVAINGTTLVPQPRDVKWEPSPVGTKLDGTNALGAYDVLTMTAPPARGGTANFNWDSFENSVLTSIVAPARGETMSSGSGTTYNSGVVSGPITVASKPGDIQETQMTIFVVT
jgi:hypothetical protein